MTQPEPFGPWLRRHREARGIGLRAMAARMGVSPTFLSRTERERCDATPAEDHLRLAAATLGLDGDDVVIRAGKVPADVREWLIAAPERVAAVRAMMRMK